MTMITYIKMRLGGENQAYVETVVRTYSFLIFWPLFFFQSSAADEILD